MQINVDVLISDLGNSCRNGWLLAAHLMGAGIITLAVEEFAHKLYNIDENSYISSVVKTIAFASGAAVSIYLAPHSHFMKFSADRFSYLCILSITPVSGMIIQRSRDRKLIHYFVIPGAIIAGTIAGHLGHRSLIPFGVIGAAAVAFSK